MQWTIQQTGSSMHAGVDPQTGAPLGTPTSSIPGGQPGLDGNGGSTYFYTPQYGPNLLQVSPGYAIAEDRLDTIPKGTDPGDSSPIHALQGGEFKSFS